MGQPPSPTDAEYLRRLREFLVQLKKLLNDFVRSRQSALPGRFHESMTAAWGDVESKFDQADSRLETEGSNLLSQLNEHGLTGPQLVFKLSVFQHAHDELADHNTRQGEPQDSRWWNRWRGLFRYTLKSADVILGSLAKVIFVLEPVKEFKEAVETALPLEPAEDK